MTDYEKMMLGLLAGIGHGVSMLVAMEASRPGALAPSAELQEAAANWMEHFGGILRNVKERTAAGNDI